MTICATCAERDLAVCLEQSAGLRPPKERCYKKDLGAERMSAVSTSTKKLYHSLRSEVVQIHYRRLLVRQLFASEDTNELLNKAARHFFTTLKWDLLDTIAIAISRLTDPAKSSRKFDNASLQQLIDSLDAGSHSVLINSLKNIYTEIKSKSARIENWRKKWAAHRDMEVIQGATPKPAMSLVEVDEVLVLIGKFLNEFECVCQDPRVEINLYGKSVSEVKEIAENERLKIGAPIDYENMVFQDDGRTILALINRANSPQ